MNHIDLIGQHMNYPFSAYSWDVLSDDVALKHLDRSTFLHRETSVPKEITPFFELPGKGLQEPRPVHLMLGDTGYDAHIHTDPLGSRYRLCWKTDLSEKIIDTFPYVYRKYALDEELDVQRPVMRFERAGQDVYRIELLENAASSEDIASDATDWTDRELEAAIYAYFTMLSREFKGRKYNRSEIIRQLCSLELIGRDRGSVEFRMQNISAVLQELCHPVLQGYLPRMAVSPGVSQRIRRIIFDRKFLVERDYTPTADHAELDRRVSVLLGRNLAGTPRGQTNPVMVQTSQIAYEQDPLVKAWVLKQARGTCELCRQHGPFKTRQGEWFLETHHVVPLTRGGRDTIENTVALCPNCHRRCHVSPDMDKLRQELRYTVERIA